ncbi:MAG TPA: FGGY-family carbohydrate kinase [Propionibacteriaceae bacterium]|nr:FGGY-family carbohydrate kinase [Propionibacteriaceae bacterium]
MEVVLGIDIGTSSTKGLLVTPDGQVVESAQRAHRISLPRPGWAEVDAEGTWWDEVRSICDILTSSAPGPIVGVCVDGVGPSLVVCDADLAPLRPAILYGIDTRATAEIELQSRRYGSEVILANAGKCLSSQALGPKLEWVRRKEPEVWQAADGWYGCHSFIVAKLTGEYVLDHHTASQCDPLYRVPAFDWHREWATEICEPLPLPRLAWPGEIIGTVHQQAAEETGLAVGTPVVAGTIDAFAEAFSVGVRDPGDLMIMYGSTMFLIQVLSDYYVHPALWTTAGVEPETHLLTAGTATAGSLTNWLQDLTGGPDFDALKAEAAQVPLGAEGLLVLPYLAGERTPVFDPDARGLVAGLTLRHGRAHLFRAAYEGIAFGVRHILDLFDESATVTRTVAVGGGVNSPLWTSIVSDVTGRAQLIPRQTIGACYGGALLAAIGTGIVEPNTDWTVIDHKVEPDPIRRAAYDELYQLWRELYPATRNQMHRLGAWANQ